MMFGTMNKERLETLHSRKRALDEFEEIQKIIFRAFKDAKKESKKELFTLFREMTDAFAFGEILKVTRAHIAAIDIFGEGEHFARTKACEIFEEIQDVISHAYMEALEESRKGMDLWWLRYIHNTWSDRKRLEILRAKKNERDTYRKRLKTLCAEMEEMYTHKERPKIHPAERKTKYTYKERLEILRAKREARDTYKETQGFLHPRIEVLEKGWKAQSIQREAIVTFKKIQYSLHAEIGTLRKILMQPLSVFNPMTTITIGNSGMISRRSVISNYSERPSSGNCVHCRQYEFIYFECGEFINFHFCDKRGLGEEFPIKIRKMSFTSDGYIMSDLFQMYHRENKGKGKDFICFWKDEKTLQDQGPPSNKNCESKIEILEEENKQLDKDMNEILQQCILRLNGMHTQRPTQKRQKATI